MVQTLRAGTMDLNRVDKTVLCSVISRKLRAKSREILSVLESQKLEVSVASALIKTDRIPRL